MISYTKSEKNDNSFEGGENENPIQNPLRFERVQI